MTKLYTPGLMVLLATACCLGQKSFEFPDGPLSASNFTYRAQLDDNYNLQWNFNSTHILFRVHVKTKGYVGFGISNNGNMFPGDVIVAWVKDGQVHFADRHTTGFVMPTLDAHQDWHLISGREDDGHTTFTMIRQLNTCDDQDMPIPTSTARLIFSYSPEDPVSDDNLQYHGSTRGTKSVLLLDPPINDDSATPSLPDDVTTIDVLNNNYSVPSKPTTYNCQVFKVPPLAEKHHVIRFEPVIQKGHERLVHHIILYFCDFNVSDSLVGTRYECYTAQTPSELRRGCNNVFHAWGIGGTAFDYPGHVGHSLGTSLDPVYLRMETHYDNFYQRSDFVDNSGIRMFLTKHLRQYDAGVLWVGAEVNELQMIPPYDDNFLSRGYCHERCLSEILGDDDEIYLFGDLLHSHLIGKSITTRIFREGKELAPILEDKHYDFDYQQTRHLKDERIVKKGDTLLTDCIYDSSKRTEFTFGGLSSQEEMCISIILYYPRKTITQCASSFDYTMDPSFIFDWNNTAAVLDKKLQITEGDWSNKTNREFLSKTMEQSGIWNWCYGTGMSGKLFHTEQPTISRPYQEKDECKA